MSDKRKNWTRDEVIVALYLYFTIPFAKVNKFHPLVKEYAVLIGRTPSALAMKIGNLGSFDKTLREKNIIGLSNASQLDRDVWQEFEGKWNQLDEVYQHIVEQFLNKAQKVPNCIIGDWIYSWKRRKKRSKCTYKPIFF